MGIYCCCGAKAGEKECNCDWTGWTEIKGDDTEPKKSGVYKVRVCCVSSGDCWETKKRFSVIPEIGSGFAGADYQLYWEDTSWDGNHVYAWKKNKSM